MAREATILDSVPSLYPRTFESLFISKTLS